MSRLLLRDVDESPSRSAWGEAADFMAGAGIPVPRILKLFDFKPHYDAITVCALFNFYNTWVDGCGVPALPDYTPSGKRIAAEGYARE